MCVADLNVSLLPCGHRWYHQLRPCAPGTTLNTCEGKLALEGWEIKCEFCPFCAGWGLTNDEFLLLGGSTDARSSNICSPLSRTSSMSTTVSTARRDSRHSSRRGSLARTDSSGSVATLSNPVFAASERNRGMNQRIDSYLNDFHTIQEARTRQAPNSTWGIGIDENDSTTNGTNGDSENNSIMGFDVMTNKVGKGWKKAKNKSRGFGTMFK
jgi:hypothetical protein